MVPGKIVFFIYCIENIKTLSAAYIGCGGMCMTYNFRNLIFEGGGVKGIAYIGAMDVLERKGILQNIIRVGGTSAGAINAVLFGLNFSAQEIKEILMQLDFKNFLDESWGIMRDSARLMMEYGWYKGDYFRNWIGSLIKQKTGNSEASFADVARMAPKSGFRELYFIGTNLSTHSVEIFSYEHTSNMRVADAVRISMSIPFFFAAPHNANGDVYSDGGILLNYPVKLFDRQKYVYEHYSVPNYYHKENLALAAEGKQLSEYVYNKETLGFRLATQQEIAAFQDRREPARHQIKDLFAFTWNLVNTVMEDRQNTHLHDDDWHRTVFIDTLGVKTTDFGITPQQKTALIDSGRINSERYFTWFDNPSNQPQNRC